MPARKLSEQQVRESVRRRLWEKSRDTETGCVEWTAYKNSKGYGSMNAGPQWLLAHRAAYALKHNLPWNFDGVVMHNCDNPACINVDHLRLGTRLENNRDSKAKGRNIRGERSHMAKLTAEDVKFIRSSSETSRALAQRLGVSPANISLIRRGINWKHVD